MKKMFLTILMILSLTNIVNAATNFIWTAPTTNVDGTPLTDLAGYKIYCGITSGAYPVTKDIGMLAADNIGKVTYPIANVLNIDITKVYYCVITAKDINGNESSYSNEVSVPLVGTAPSIPTVFGVK